MLDQFLCIVAILLQKLSVVHIDLIDHLTIEFRMKLRSQETLFLVEIGLDAAMRVCGQKLLSLGQLGDFIKVMMPYLFTLSYAMEISGPIEKGDRGPSCLHPVWADANGPFSKLGPADELVSITDAHLLHAEIPSFSDKGQRPFKEGRILRDGKRGA